VDVGTRVALGAVFVWLGMVVAISFLEAPLKFRAPGVTLAVGLGIGRLVFRALNACEFVLAVVIAAALFTRDSSLRIDVPIAVATGTLLIQNVVVRPLLSRRTAAVLAGEEGPRSRAHYVYIALELVKVIALIAAGVQLTSG
jgi:hypothetical protein